MRKLLKADRKGLFNVHGDATTDDVLKKSGNRAEIANLITALPSDGIICLWC